MTTAQQEPGEPYIWDSSIPLIPNRHIVLDSLKIWSIASAVCIVLISIIGFLYDGWKIEDIIAAVQILVAAAAGLYVITICLISLFYRNRFYAVFRVDSKGAYYSVAGNQDRVDSTVVMHGNLNNRPGIVGSQAMVKSTENGFIPWSEVYNIVYYPQTSVIVLKNTWRTLLLLYCTKNNYEPVSEIVREGFERFAQDRQRAIEAGIRKKTESLHRTFSVSTILSIMASFAVLATPIVDIELYGWHILAVGMLVVVSCVYVGLGYKIILAAAFLGSVCLAAVTLLFGLRKIDIIPGIVSHTEFYLTYDSPERIQLLASLFGTVMLLYVATRNIIKLIKH